jgi:hypothetical protein
LHIFFYVFGFIVLVWGGGVAGVIVTEGRHDPDGTPLIFIILGALIFYLAAFAMVLGIRAWAAAVDRRHGKPQTDGAHATTPALPSQA